MNSSSEWKEGKLIPGSQKRWWDGIASDLTARHATEACDDVSAKHGLELLAEQSIASHQPCWLRGRSSILALSLSLAHTGLALTSEQSAICIKTCSDRKDPLLLVNFNPFSLLAANVQYGHARFAHPDKE